MKPTQASVITIGNELLIGQTIDTNSAFIGQELNKIGIWVRKRVAVGDDALEIKTALDQESLLSDIIILTGGLGPTADDITKPLLCEYFGGQMRQDPETLEHIRYLFEQVYKRPGAMLERNSNQANVPDNCIVLKNPVGTAPGMLFEKKGKIFISLPGVPKEMKDLMQTAVLPYLEKNCQRSAIVHLNLLTAGIGESVLAELIQDFENSLPPSVSVAYLPNYGMVKLRLTGIGNNEEALKDLMNPLFDELKKLTADYLVTDVEESLEETLGKLLVQKKSTIGTAESCTGGLIGQMISSVPGASTYYKGSVVSYANEIKESLLKVNPSTLETAGAVSEKTVLEMANGALQTLKTDYIIAVTGIMGPQGGSPDKPVGTVWVAVGNSAKLTTKKLQLGFDRLRNTQQTAVTSLNLLRQFIREEP
jgi:nicotinamide-nucleotide amidase